MASDPTRPLLGRRRSLFDTLPQDFEGQMSLIAGAPPQAPPAYLTRPPFTAGPHHRLTAQAALMFANALRNLGEFTPMGAQLALSQGRMPAPFEAAAAVAEDPNRTTRVLRNITSLDHPDEMEPGELETELAVGATPIIGGVQAIRDAVRDVRAGNYPAAFLNALTAIPDALGAGALTAATIPMTLRRAKVAGQLPKPQAAFKHPVTGRIIKTGEFHDLDAIEDPVTRRLVEDATPENPDLEGFAVKDPETGEEVFLTRPQAAELYGTRGESTHIQEAAAQQQPAESSRPMAQVTASAIRMPDGTIHSAPPGGSHAEAAARAIGYNSVADMPPPGHPDWNRFDAIMDQGTGGFVTGDGQFLTREEAFEAAKLRDSAQLAQGGRFEVPAQREFQTELPFPEPSAANARDNVMRRFQEAVQREEVENPSRTGRVTTGVRGELGAHALNATANDPILRAKLNAHLPDIIRDMTRDSRLFSVKGFEPDQDVIRSIVDKYEMPLNPSRPLFTENQGTPFGRSRQAFYSRLQDAIKEGPRKATGVRWLKQIQSKTHKDERRFTGIEKFLEENRDKSLTREEVWNAANERPLTVEETRLTKDTDVDYDDQRAQYWDEEYDRLASEFEQDVDFARENAAHAEDQMEAARREFEAEIDRVLAELPDDLEVDADELVRELEDLIREDRQHVSDGVLRDLIHQYFGEEAVDQMTDAQFNRLMDAGDDWLRRGDDWLDAEAGVRVEEEAYDAFRDDPDRFIDMSGFEAQEPPGPQYEDYTMDGPADNYEERLIRVAGGPGAKGPHFEEPDIAAHVRTTDRRTETGRGYAADEDSVKFIEEAQSDLAQDVRDQGGFALPPDELWQARQAARVPALDSLPYELRNVFREMDLRATERAKLDAFDPADEPALHARYLTEAWGDLLEGRAPSPAFFDPRLNYGRDTREGIQDVVDRHRGAITDELRDQIKKANEIRQSGVLRRERPEMPFIGATSDWVGAVWKTTIDDAIEEGRDFLAWTTGDMQNKRYGLAQFNVDGLAYNPKTRELKVYRDGQVVHNRTVRARDGGLRGLIGKPNAEKLKEGRIDAGGFYHIDFSEGQDFGGKGMREFYGDERGLNEKGELAIFPKWVMDTAKKRGVDLEIVQIPMDFGEDGVQMVPAFRVSDLKALRDKPTKGKPGFPLIQFGGLIGAGAAAGAVRERQRRQRPGLLSTDDPEPAGGGLLRL